MTDDQVEDILSNRTQVPIFAPHLAESQAAKLALRDIEERHRDLTLLEESIREVNSLFQEIGLLVELQGEKIDRIETTIVDVVDQTERGVVQLKQAKKSQKKYRKCKIILAASIAIVVLIVVTVLVVTFA